MIDLEKLKTIYNIGVGLQLKDVKTIIAAATEKTFASGEFLIEEGALKKDLFYIKKGLIRIYRVTERGDEITMGLRAENQFFASPELILFNKPAKSYFEAFEETITYTMGYDFLQTFVKKNPNLSQSRQLILQKMLRDALVSVESFILHSPEERYLKFIDENPSLVNRVPNKYIANILGITPVSLSRIRKRIASKK